MSGATDDTTTGGGRHRRRVTVTVIGLALAVLMIGAAYRAVSNDRNGEDESTAQPPSTARVTLGTISDTRTFPGALGYGEATSVTAAVPGTVTGLSGPGASVEVGSELFRINERPVIALRGAVPMFRDIRSGATGADVAQLIANLTALGYAADCEPVDEVDWCVTDAIRGWQEDLGVAATGVVGIGDVVFLPSDGRVDTLHSRIGGAVVPGSPVLEVTGLEQIVTVEMELRHRDLLQVGIGVEVQFPGGVTASGIVTAIAIVSGTGGSTGGGESDPYAVVEIRLPVPVDDAFLGSTVDLVVEIDTRADVLTVPVNALLALTGGGHGVEVVGSDGATTIVPVETGLFTRGLVEVSGDGIDEGMVVVVAGR